MKKISSLLMLAVLLSSIPACKRRAPRTRPDAAAAPAARGPAPRKPGARTGSASVPRGRLPRDVVPSSYRLSLEILPEKDRFSGEVGIAVKLRKKLSSIWLHGRGLKVHRARVIPTGGKPITARYEQVTRGGVSRLTLAHPAGPGKATLELSYDAPFNHRNRGIHKVVDGKGAYVFTQFEPTSARRCFPGFDDPGFKTPFEIDLVVHASQVAIANSAEVKEERLPGGKKRVRFARTARLPTYLVALAVGPLEVVAGKPLPPTKIRKRPLALRVVAPRGKGKLAAYALRETPGILRELERYFGMPYPFDKLDLIAVTGKGGAMENPGAVTFGDFLLLVDPRDAPERQRRMFARVMAHELAHMWFGDLVTLRWWDDTWLNESFSEWLANRTVQRWRPALRAGLAQISGMVGRAFNADSLVSARAIRQPIRSPHDIRNAFDAITYQKGSAVLGMFERFVGKKRFRKGVRGFVRKYAHGNATAKDFLAELSAAGGSQVSGAFQTFINQPGLPLVEVRTACRSGATEVTLTQSRYLPLGSRGNRNRTWKLPLCVRYAMQGPVQQACVLLEKPVTRWRLPGAGCARWLHPNAGGTGYYRFVLSPRALTELRARAGTQLTVGEQVVLADSILSAWRAGRLPLATALRELAPYAASRHDALARMPMRMLRVIRANLLPKGDLPRLEAYGRRLYAPVLARLGLRGRAGEPGDRRVLRRRVVEFLADVARDPGVRQKLARIGRAYIGFGGDGGVHTDVADPELADVALGVAAQEGGKPFFDAVLAILRRSRDSLLRARLVRAIATITEPKLARRVRALAMSPILQMVELFYLMGTHASQPENRVAVWNATRKFYDRITKRIPPTAAAYLIAQTGSLCDPARRKEVKAFFGPKIESIPGAPRHYRAALERIDLCVALKKRNHDAAHAFFAGVRL